MKTASGLDVFSLLICNHNAAAFCMKNYLLLFMAFWFCSCLAGCIRYEATKRRLQITAGGVVTNLEDVPVPFVTSSKANAHPSHLVRQLL